MVPPDIGAACACCGHAAQELHEPESWLALVHVSGAGRAAFLCRPCTRAANGQHAQATTAYLEAMRKRHEASATPTEPAPPPDEPIDPSPSPRSA